MILTEFNKNIIKEQALRESPNECCGLFYLPPDSFMPVAAPTKNIDKDPANFFTVCPKDYLMVSLRGQIQAYYHSHIEESCFSDFDKLVAEKLKLVSIMYCLKNDKFYEYSPVGHELPFVGRQYIIGMIDCFCLVKDYYAQTYNIAIEELENDYRFIEHKPDHPDNNKVHNVLSDHFESNGFVKVNNYKDGNVVLMNTPDILSPVHCAIYREPNQILHHPFKKKSCLSLFTDIKKKYTTHIYRHKLML